MEGTEDVKTDIKPESIYFLSDHCDYVLPGVFTSADAATVKIKIEEEEDQTEITMEIKLEDNYESTVIKYEDVSLSDMCEDKNENVCIAYNIANNGEVTLDCYEDSVVKTEGIDDNLAGEEQCFLTLIAHNFLLDRNNPTQSAFQNSTTINLRKERISSNKKVNRPQTELDNYYSCSVCKRELTTKRQLERHIRRHNVTEPLSCLQCGKTYKDHGDMSRHITMEHKKAIISDPYKCDICNLLFETSAAYNQHNNTHSTKMFECGFCHKQYHRKWDFLAHVKKHAPDPTTIHIQRVNPVSTSQQKDEIEKIQKPYENPVKQYGNRFSVPRRDYNTKSYYKYAAKDVLEYNKKAIITETDLDSYYFECSVCQRELATKTQLVLHMRRHDVTEPVSCLICGKTFKLKGDVARHITITHGKGAAKEPYKCEICNMLFRNSVEFTQHNSNHAAKPFECGICHKLFQRKWNYSSHVSKHHG